MVNTTDFGKRIHQIMEYYALSASGFADVMGVGRSSISHILSGRNKPSLDFVMKIAESYPEAELHWILYGEGTFPKSKKIVSKPEENSSTSVNNTPPTALPKSNPKIDTAEINPDLFSQPTSVSQNKSNASTIEELETIDTIKQVPISSGKEIHQIVFFYKDGTFDAYKN